MFAETAARGVFIICLRVRSGFGGRGPRPALADEADTRAEQGRADAASARTEPRGASGEDGGRRGLAWSPRPQGQAGVRVNPNTRGLPGVSREKPSLLPLRPSPTRRLRPMDWKIWYFEIWVQRTLQTIFQTFSFQQKLQNCICQELFFLNFLIPGIFQRKFTHMVLIHLLLIHQDVVL